MVAIDSKLLKALLDKLAHNFLPPMAAVLTQNVMRTFSGLINKQHVLEFVAQQEAFIGELAELEIKNKGLNKRDADIQVRRLITNTAAISTITSKHQNPPIDPLAVV